MKRFAAFIALLSGCASAGENGEAVWTLTPLHTGICWIGKDHALGPEYSERERLPFVIYSFLAEGPGGETALIDLGPKSLEYTNAMFRRFGFFREKDGDRVRPDDVLQPHGNVFDHLKRRGIAPERVGRILFTHFHADHHGMDDATNGGAAEDFPNARMCVSEKGWSWNVSRRRNGRWDSYLDHAFGDFLMRAERERRLDRVDDGEVLPGLEVRYLGGHSPCSRAIMVRTRMGWVAITSDDVYRYDLLEKGVMAALHVTPKALVDSTDLLTSLATSEKYSAVLLPLHEPAIWEAWKRSGQGWVEELRPRSEAAVAGYLERRKDLKILDREAHSGGR